MPRMDAQFTPDEIREMQRERNYRERNFAYRNTNHGRLTSAYYGAPRSVPPELRPMLATGETLSESFRHYGYPLYLGPLMASPDRHDHPCNCAEVVGCSDCRPDVFGHCDGCSNDYPVAHGCDCWETCHHCNYRGNSDEWVVGTDSDGNSVAFCSYDHAFEAGYESCATSYCSDVTADPSGFCVSHRPCNCGRCYECRSRFRIHNYSYKPRPIFHGDGPLYLGLECELNTGYSHSRGTVAEYVTGQVGNLAYMKEDGSLSNGFELVTHPMSYPWALENFPWHMFTEMRDRFGMRNADECGIHVHVSRDGFSDVPHLYRWQKFIYRNALPIQRVARRQNSRWARFTPEGRRLALPAAKLGPNLGCTPVSDQWWAPPEYRSLPTTYGNNYLRAERYSALNLQNGATVEMRMFAGSVYQSQVKAALGLAHASVEYTRTLTVQKIAKGGGWDWDAFTTWTSDRPEYSALNSEIERLCR